VPELAVGAEWLCGVGRISREGEGVGVVHPAQLVVAAAALALLALLLLLPAGVLPLLVGPLRARLQKVQQPLLVEDGLSLAGRRQQHQHQHAQRCNAHHVSQSLDIDCK
jgi:hypothetical protein